jgi:dynactin complex subunit
MFDNLSPNMKAAIFTAFVGALGGGGTWIYSIGFNNGARDVATLEAFKGKLPTLIDDIDKVSRSLSEKTELIELNKKLAKETADAVSDKRKFEGQIKSQAKEIEDQKKRIADLDTLVANVFPTGEKKISIAKGSAERIIPNILTIGVTFVYSSSVATNVNGRSMSFEPL